MGSTLLKAQNPELGTRQVTGEEFEYAFQELLTMQFTDDGSGAVYPLKNDNGTVTSLTQWNKDASPQAEPICYKSGSVPQVTAVFTNCISNIWIKGIVKANDDITLYLEPRELTPSGATGEVTYGPEPMKTSLPITQTFAFVPNTIRYFEDFQIEWKMSYSNSPNENDWQTITTTSNQMYALYGTPEDSKPYHTVVHLGCKNADGMGGPEATAGISIVDAMFEPFENPIFNVRRISDNAKITYYKDNVTPNTCTNIVSLLANPANQSDPNNPYVDGKCGAMGELFYRVIRDQGLTLGRGNKIMPKGMLIPGLPATQMATESIIKIGEDAVAKWGPNHGVMILTLPTGNRLNFFLVKEWPDVTESDFIMLDGSNWGEAQSDLGGPGIKGQGGVDDPRSIFPDHVYIHYNGKTYDPSYGTTLNNVDLNSYEEDSLAAVRGTLVRRIENGAFAYYFWVEKIGDTNMEDTIEFPDYFN